VWRPSFSLVEAYVDQMERNKSVCRPRTAVRGDIANAERATGPVRHDALTRLATQLEGDAKNSSDGPKVQTLSQALTSLSNTPVP
jgi:hypothetical protein